MKLDEYNLEAYKFIRIEIDNRVQLHYKMVMWKIAIGGSLIAFLVDKIKTFPISPFMLAAIFLFLMDIIIVENLGHIRSAGRFIKDNIENFRAKNRIIKWENDFAQAGNNWGCFSISGYVFGIWIIAPFLIIISFIIDFDPTDKLDLSVLMVALYLAGYSLFLITKELGANKIFHIEKSPSPIKDES